MPILAAIIFLFWLALPIITVAYLVSRPTKKDSFLELYNEFISFGAVGTVYSWIIMSLYIYLQFTYGLIGLASFFMIVSWPYIASYLFE